MLHNNFLMTYFKELQRKAIHLSSLWTVMGIYYLEFGVFIKILYLVSFLVLTFDILRHYDTLIAKISHMMFGSILREHEQHALSGASYMMIAACICCSFFAKETAMLALGVLIISDAFAAIIGKRYGKQKIYGKSLMGAMAFIISGILIAWLIHNILALDFWWLIYASIAVFFASLIELYGKLIRLDDNLSIPLTIALTMSWL
jgi:dolichol kinase